MANVAMQPIQPQSSQQRVRKSWQFIFYTNCCIRNLLVGRLWMLAIYGLNFKAAEVYGENGEAVHSMDRNYRTVWVREMSAYN